jgi:hypothetical protein
VNRRRRSRRLSCRSSPDFGATAQRLASLHHPPDLRPLRPVVAFAGITGDDPLPAGISGRFACGIGAACAKNRRSSGDQKCRFPGTLAGATGLEPATSGVTGRAWWFRAAREHAGIWGVSRAFTHRQCGDWRVPAAASGSIVRDQRGTRRCLLLQKNRDRSIGGLAVAREAVAGEVS